MEKIKCVIVDDEISAIKNLEKFVQQIPQLELVATFSDPIEAKEYIVKSNVYVVFLDINMDGLSGIELAKLIKCKVIFTTGHEEFARDSWRLDNAIGYLTKPIFFEDVVNVIKRIFTLFSAENIASRFNNDIYFTYKMNDEIVKLPYDSIVYFEANRNYSTIRLDDGEKFAPIPLWELEKSLPKNQFVRVSKSVIANKNKILETNGKEILLLGGHTQRLSKVYLEKATLKNPF